MNNITITIQTTDNRTQAFGYAPKFYKDANTRNADITKDMLAAKERFGAHVAIVMVAEWEDSVENSNGTIYKNIDEVLETYKTTEPVEAEGEEAPQYQWTKPDGTPEKP